MHPELMHPRILVVELDFFMRNFIYSSRALITEVNVNCQYPVLIAEVNKDPLPRVPPVSSIINPAIAIQTFNVPLTCQHFQVASKVGIFFLSHVME